MTKGHESDHETDGLIFVFILVLISIVLLWDKHVKIVSSSVFAMGLGMMISILWKSAMNAPFEFAPEMFLYLMLPPILLHSSLKFKMASLRKNWLASLSFATLGTMLSMIWIAWGIMVWTRGTPLQMSLPSALAFASVLAPTDTVATMAMTRDMTHSDQYIFEVLENESVMNDALSVVLVRLFGSLSSEMDRWVPLEIVGYSVLSSIVSIFFGWFVAHSMNTCKVTSLTNHYLVSLLVYGCCESINVSGILGLFVYGSVISPPKEFEASIASFSNIVEAYVYLTLGLAFHSYDWTFFGVSMLVFLSCIVGRVLMVFSIGSCLNMFEKKWHVRSLLFFSMCGVRGAISYALCMSMDSGFMKSTTFLVIVCTTFLFGTLQKCLFRMLLEGI